MKNLFRPLVLSSIFVTGILIVNTTYATDVMCKKNACTFRNISKNAGGEWHCTWKGTLKGDTKVILRSDNVLISAFGDKQPKGKMTLEGQAITQLNDHYFKVKKDRTSNGSVEAEILNTPDGYLDCQEGVRGSFWDGKYGQTGPETE